MKQFKQVSDWIKIDRVDEDVPMSDYMRPVFEFENQIYHICDFTKIHNNPWFGSDKDFPDLITGVERDSNGEPLFIEISDDGEQVRVYLEDKDGGNDV